MAVTYGIDFPFRDSTTGNFLRMTNSPEREVRANLIHFENEIRDSVRKYIPNLDINSINIVPGDQDPDQSVGSTEDEDNRLYRVSDYSSKPYTAKVKIDYTVNNGTFSTSDFVIINI